MISDFSDIGRENIDIRGSTMVQNQRKVLDNRRITACFDKSTPNSVKKLNSTSKLGELNFFSSDKKAFKVEKSPRNQIKQESKFSLKLINR